MSHGYDSRPSEYGNPRNGGPGHHSPYGPPGPNGWYPSPAPSRSRIALVIAIALAIAGALVFTLTRSGEEPAEAVETADTADPAEMVETPSPSPDLTPEEAQQAVEAYFTALSDGDAVAALALIDTNLDTTLVDNEFYEGVTNRPVLDELTVIHAGQAQVVLSAELTGADGPAETEFVVESIDGSIRITSAPYFKLSLLSEESFKINGEEIRLPGGTDYLLLPGDWGFEYASYSWQLRVTADGDGIEVDGSGTGQTGSTDDGQALTEEEMAEVSGQIFDQISSCLTDPNFVPFGCENTLYMDDPGIAVTQITRTVDAPTITYSSDGDQHYAELSGGSISIDYLERDTEDDTWAAGEMIYRKDIFEGVRLPIEGRGSDIRVDGSGL